MHFTLQVAVAPIGTVAIISEERAGTNAAAVAVEAASRL
jgi:hypothetical protein